MQSAGCVENRAAVGRHRFLDENRVGVVVDAKLAERSGAGGQNPQRFRDFGQTTPAGCFLKEKKNLQGSGMFSSLLHSAGDVCEFSPPSLTRLAHWATLPNLLAVLRRVRVESGEFAPLRKSSKIINNLIKSSSDAKHFENSPTVWHQMWHNPKFGWKKVAIFKQCGPRSGLTSKLTRK